MKFEFARSQNYSFEVVSSRKTKDLFDIAGLICQIQGLFPQYSLLSLQRHKALRVTMGQKPISSKLASKQIKEINDFSAENFIQACRLCAHFVHNYYNDRLSSPPPKFCVKIPDRDTVEDVFRCDSSGRDIYDINKQTAFKYIKKHGKFFLCNDIPSAVVNNKYENSRLNIDEVKRHYKPPGYFKKIYYKAHKQPDQDEKWAGYWDRDSESEKDLDSCYKSTLVVPMTMVNGALKSEFRDLMFGSDDFEKFTFGFACFGHSKYGYFLPQDVKVAYIIADLLSLFMIHSNSLTKLSSNYKKALSHLGK